MTALRYSTGEEVRVGDRVDIGHGHGPQSNVVVVIPSGEAAPGYAASEWAYLKEGVMLQSEGMGLVHISTLDEELVFIRHG